MRTKIINILVEAAVAKGKVEGLADSLLSLFNENRVSGESHPPYQENGKMFVWCSRHQQYHESDIMVPNKSKECGFANYCKPAQRKWEWMHAHSQKLGAVSSRLFVDKKYEEGTEIALLAEKLKNEKNKPYMFNNISTDMDIKQVVESCVNEFYTKSIVKLIPEDFHKSLGIK